MPLPVFMSFFLPASCSSRFGNEKRIVCAFARLNWSRCGSRMCECVCVFAALWHDNDKLNQLEIHMRTNKMYLFFFLHFFSVRFFSRQRDIHIYCIQKMREEIVLISVEFHRQQITAKRTHDIHCKTSSTNCSDANACASLLSADDRSKNWWQKLQKCWNNFAVHFNYNL